jgi:hypothetical protein
VVHDPLATPSDAAAEVLDREQSLDDLPPPPR